jgi:hypothetical protein
MRVRLKFDGSQKSGDTRFAEMSKLPRVGEQLVSGTFGTCEVVRVLKTPESKEGDATVFLRRETSGG